MSGKVDTAAEIAQSLKDCTKTKVSTDTVHCALKEAGMKAMTKKKKPCLLPRHVCQQLGFAIKYQHWTVEDWKHVIWSDETKIN